MTQVGIFLNLFPWVAGCHEFFHFTQMVQSVAVVSLYPTPVGVHGLYNCCLVF